MTPPSIPDYTFRALIGDGSTGRVFAAEYGGQTLMALKAFDADCINRQLISDALVKLYNREEHPGVVKIHDFDLASTQAYVATSLHGEPFKNAEGQELIRPRTIQGLMGHLITEDAWGYVRQIASALGFLHRQRVLHCNLKPSNVLLDDSTPPQIKLTDFSQGLVGAVPNLIPGDSVFYAAPEQIRQPEHYFRGRAERWDVYAFGVLAYQLLTGEYPRLGAAITEIKKREAAALDVHFSYDYKVLADMIEKQADYEWPSPATNDDEAACRAIIDRCLQVAPEDRYPDMREALLAFNNIEDERKRREEHRKIAAEQLKADKQAGSLKKICAALGVLALGGLGGAAYFSQKGGGGDDSGGGSWMVSPADPSSSNPTKSGGSGIELAEMKALLASSREDLTESQSTLDEIFGLVIARDSEGNPKYDLPEDSRGFLLNYYEEFASKFRDDPSLARQVATAENNAGEIKLSLGDAESALPYFQSAVERVKALRGQSPEDVRLTIAAARFTQHLSEAHVLAGRSQAAADAAVESNQIWDGLHQANSTSAEATRALASSLLYLGQRMLEIDRPADTALHVQRAKTILEGLEAGGEIAEADLVALSRCEHILGKSERARDNLSDAIALQMEAVDRMLNLKISTPTPPRDQLFALATYYGEFADCLAENGNGSESNTANTEATKLLVELVDAAPDISAYHFQLARRFNTKAALLRDAGKGKEARAAQADAVDVLKDLLKVNPKRYDISHELAIQLGDMTDLYAEGGMKQEVIYTAFAAVTEMGDLLKEDLDIENNDAKRAEYRLTYGDAQVRYARYLDKYGKKDEAIKYYTKGANQYESLVSAELATDEIKKELAAVKARLKALGS